MRTRTRRIIAQSSALLLVAAGLALVLFGPWRGHPLVEGRRALAEGEYGEAVRLLSRAVSRGQHAAGVFRDLARAHRFLMQYGEAARYMQRAMELEPENLELGREYGEILILGGDRESPPARSAEAYAQELLARPDGDAAPYGHFILGKALHRRYRLEKERLTEEIVSSFQGPNVWQLIGAIRYALGAEDFFGTARTELVNYAQKLVGLAPTDPLYDRVDAIRRAQEGALAALHAAAERPAHHGYPLLELAEFQLDLRQPARAETLARSLLAAPGDTVADEVRIEAQRVLARALEADEEATPARLREAASYWGAYIYGLDRLDITPREQSLRRFEAHDARGNIFIRMESARDLKEVAQSLLQADRSDAHGLFFRGMAAFFESRYREAEIDLQQSLNKRQDFVTYMTLGRILALRGGAEEAEQALQYFGKAGRLDPKSVEPILAEVRLYLDRPDPNYLDAHAKILHALRRHLRLGKHTQEVLELRKRVEEALLKRDPHEEYSSPAEAEAALALDERAPYPLYYLARHHLEAGRVEAAARLASRLERSAPNSMLAALLHARILIRSGTPVHLAKAEQLLQRAHELDSTDGRPIALAARVAKAMGNGGKYWRLLNRVLEIDPQDVNSRLEIAQLLFEGKQFKAARYHLDMALEQMKTTPYDVRRLDIELHLKLGHADRAAAALAQLERMPEVPAGDLALYRGQLLELQGKPALAVDAYARGSEEAPDRADLVVAAARLEIAQKDEAAALERLEALRRRGGKDLEANALLGDLYLKRWRLAEAEVVFDEMRRLNYGDIRGQHGFAICTLHLGKRRHEGVAALMFELSMLPRDAAAAERVRGTLLALLYSLLELKQWQPAVDHLRKLEALDPGSPQRDRAFLAYFNGDKLTCRRLVEQGIASAPEEPYLRLLRGLLDLENTRADPRVIRDVAALVPGPLPEARWGEWAERAARARPGFGRLILAGVADVLLRLNRVEASAAILAAATRAYPGDPRLEYLSAHLAYRQGKRTEALAALERLATTAGPEAVRDRAILLALAGDSGAVPLMADYARHVPGVGRKLLAWARFEAGRGNQAELLRTLQGRPHWRWTLPDQTLLTVLAYIVDGPEGALRQVPGPETLAGPYLDRFVRNAPSGERAPGFIEMLRSLVRGLALLDQPRFRVDAAAALDEALAADPEHPLLLALRARLAADADDENGATARLERITGEADRPLRAFERARLLARRPTDPEAATDALAAAVAMKPGAPEPCTTLAAFLLEQERPGDAIDVLTQGMARGVPSSDPRVQTLLGEALVEQGDRVGAVTAFARALQSDPFDRHVAYRMAMEMLAVHRYFETAAIVFARYPTLTTEYPDLRLAVGLALFRFGFFDRSRKFLEGFPYSGEAAICLGHIARRAENREEAVRQYRYAFSLDRRRYLGALLEIVDIHRQAYEFREALAVVNEYLQWRPLDAHAQELQARLTESLFRPDQALREWIEAWMLDRANPTPLLKCAGLLRRKGKIDEARILIRMLKQWPHPLDEGLQRELQKESLLLGL